MKNIKLFIQNYTFSENIFLFIINFFNIIYSYVCYYTIYYYSNDIINHCLYNMNKFTKNVMFGNKKRNS